MKFKKMTKEVEVFMFNFCEQLKCYLGGIDDFGNYHKNSKFRELLNQNIAFEPNPLEKVQTPVNFSFNAKFDATVIDIYNGYKNKSDCTFWLSNILCSKVNNSFIFNFSNSSFITMG
jgi:hypothetical protein